MSSAKASEAASLATSTQPSSPPPPPPPLNGDSSNRTAGKPSDNHELTLPERARSQNENEEKPARNPDDGDIDADEDEDEEDMGTKAKALSKLLQTSSVFVAIMAEKMRDQQKRQREKAESEAKKKAAAAAGASASASAANTPAQEESQPSGPTRTLRRSTRVDAGRAPAESKGSAQSQPETNTASTRKNSGKAKSKKNSAGNSITNYFGKVNVDIPQENPSVQEALAEVATNTNQADDEKQQHQSAPGEQDHVATQQPSLITGGTMREYQLEGLEWLKSLWMNGLCGILADEMGLGKTVQAISLLAFFKEHNVAGPYLIAAPLSTVSNWVEEFAFWAPQVKTVLYHGSREERAEVRRKYMNPQDQKQFDFPVVCTSYEICMNDRKFLSKYQWKYIIVDEGHRLKNMNCRLIKELLTYPSANRLLITGTPLQNNIAELWSLLHFLLPEIFNDLDSFQSWFDFSSVLDSSAATAAAAVAASSNEQKQSVTERRKRNLVSTMHAILKPFLLRRLKTDVESALPKKREYVLYAPLAPEQKDLYLAILNGSSRQYLERRTMEVIEARMHAPSSGRKTSAAAAAAAAGGAKRRRSTAANTEPNKRARPGEDSIMVTPRNQGRNAKRKAQSLFREMGDDEFETHLENMENGIDAAQGLDEEQSSDENRRNDDTIKLYKRQISAKKLQNPVIQARLACDSPHNFYWPWMDEDDAVDSSLVSSSGKMIILDRLVPRLMAGGHKILIFSQFKTQLDILHDWAQQLHSWQCCRIDGSIQQADRHEQIRAFNTDPACRIFLLSTRAGGQGINLTAADTVILFDSDWNPQQDLQAQDRAHRIGQTKPVLVYRLATRGTIEQNLLERADVKRRLEKLVIQKGKFRSLLDQSSATATTAGAGAGAGEDGTNLMLNEEGLEVFDAGAGRQGATAESLLSDQDLSILTDRSDEAYERAEKGLDKEGGLFTTVKKEEQNMRALGA